MVKEALRRAAQRLGYEVRAFTPMRSHQLRRAKLLRDERVGMVLDGGANKGQYATELRRFGYSGEIVSVEPLPGVFGELSRLAVADPAWKCVNAALAREMGSVELRLAEISEVSSVFRATGVQNTDGWATSRTLQVPAITVDSLLASTQRPFVKLDLQGYELEALQGATATLEFAVAIEVELSTVLLYEGAALLPEVVSYLDARGYSLFSIEPALVDYESARVLQLDGLFVRS
jgi:FkbM family methyltransferase